MYIIGAMAKSKKQPNLKQRNLSSKKAPRTARTGSARVAAGRRKSVSDRDWQADIGSLYKPIKKPVTLRLDADVLAWFKVDGRGYQTRINKVLRKLMSDQRRRS